MQHHLIHIDGLVVDTATGEILGYDAKQSIYDAPYSYSTPVVNPFAIRVCRANGYQLDPEQHESTTDYVMSVANLGSPDSEDNTSRRGPKPKVLSNLLARHIQVANAEGMGWIDDHVYGACYVVAGISNGKLNASPCDVLRVCMLDSISTDSVQAVIRNHVNLPVSKPQARRLAQVARYAVGGINHYLHSNPDIKHHLDYEVDFAAAYQQAQPQKQAA